MKLSNRVTVALTILPELVGVQTPTPGCKLAERHDLAYGHVADICTSLARAGILQVERGRLGGYRLAKPPSAISLREVVEAVDGPLFPHFGQSQSVRYVNGTIDLLVRGYLNTHTLGDVCAFAQLT